jgi:unsaturated rhamnogalacturonyl hydrolase
MYKPYIYGFIFLFVSIQTMAQQSTAPDSVLKIMNKVATWQIGAFEKGSVTIPKTNWENGALYTGMVALLNMENKTTYHDFLYGIGESNNWDMGKIRLFADDYCVAQLYTQLYMKYKEPKMISKWVALADTIVARPFNEPLMATQKNINHREWAWCDALFMGPPSLAYLSTAKNDLRYLKKADSLWWKTSAYLYDQKEHLFYRDSHFFTRKEANGEKVFWSRGNGWVLAGLVRMMENMPENFKNKKKYVKQYKEMASRISGLQQADGSWHASLLDPVTFADKETSGTGFYCYALSWGINHGLLSAKKYKPIVEKAWAAMVAAVHPDGKLGYVQKVGSGPIATSYDTTNVYGVGAFLLAGTELYKLL